MSKRRESENEDDPEPFQSSGDEWDLEQAKREESGRRKSTRLSKKPKRTVVDESGSESEDSDFSSDGEPRKRKKNGVTNKRTKNSTPIKKTKKEAEVKSEEDDKDFSNSAAESEASESSKTNSNDNSSNAQSNYTRGIHRKFIPKTIFSEDYATGSFVILKKDAQVGDSSKHPSIWRIDGKALLQKYEAFDEEGKVRHKNTSIYTGWSPLDKDLYAPVTVDVVRHNNQNLTVELHWDKLKVINADSD